MLRIAGRTVAVILWAAPLAWFGVQHKWGTFAVWSLVTAVVVALAVRQGRRPEAPVPY